MFISTTFKDTQYAGFLLGVLAVTIVLLFQLGVAALSYKKGLGP